MMRDYSQERKRFTCLVSAVFTSCWSLVTVDCKAFAAAASFIWVHFVWSKLFRDCLVKFFTRCCRESTFAYMLGWPTGELFQ